MLEYKMLCLQCIFARNKINGKRTNSAQMLALHFSFCGVKNERCIEKLHTVVIISDIYKYVWLPTCWAHGIMCFWPICGWVMSYGRRYRSLLGLSIQLLLPDLPELSISHKTPADPNGSME